MSDGEVEALTRRLDRVERGLWRWRVFGGIAWIALAACVAVLFAVLFRAPEELESAQDDPEAETAIEDEVKARAFVLVDDEGRPRAALAMRPDGTPALAFTAEDGHITWRAP